jgi:c-di-GMP-binding flagellar brake protein YcgR
MASNDLYKNDLESIYESVKLYQKTILDDINLTLRVITRDKTYITKLVDWPGEKFIFAAPLDKLDWVLLERDKIVKISFITKTAIFSANVQILSQYKKRDVLYYGAALVTPLVKQQQRQYFRLDVLLDLLYRVLPKDGEPHNLDELPSVKATSVNISVGGMCLVSSQQLQKGDKLIINFDFINVPMEIAGEVLYKGEKNPAGNYLHRIRFLNQNNNVRNLLSKLIFEKQRMLMSKPREF